jgi:uncharacterized protein YjbJ (UPF0337 family)
MNRDIVEGNWTQLKGRIKQAWGKLTDDEIDMFQGKRDEFYGLVQERYGLARDDAEKELRRFEERETV